MTLVFIVSGEFDGWLPDEMMSAPEVGLDAAAAGWVEAVDLAGRAVALERYCRALHRRVVAAGIVTAVDLEVVSEFEFSYADLEASTPIRVEVMSQAGVEP